MCCQLIFLSIHRSHLENAKRIFAKIKTSSPDHDLNKIWIPKSIKLTVTNNNNNHITVQMILISFADFCWAVDFGCFCASCKTQQKISKEMWNIITDICKITMPKNSFFFLLKFNLFCYFFASSQWKNQIFNVIVVVILVRNIWINMLFFVLFWLFTSSQISCLSAYKNVFSHI